MTTHATCPRPPRRTRRPSSSSPRAALRSVAPRLAALLATAAFLAPTASSQQGPVGVRVAPVLRESVQELRLVVGGIRPVRRSLVASEEDGRVTELLVREGQAVTAGEVLCRLDATRLVLEREVLSAQEAEQVALLEMARLEAEQAERDARTLEDLSGRAAANPKELADARTAEQVTRSVIAQRERQLARVRASLSLLGERLEDLEIRAPFAGVVVAKRTDVGQWLSAGDPVVSMVSRELEAWLNVPQALYGPMVAHAGAVVVTVDAVGCTVELDSFRIVPDVDAAGRSFSVAAPLPAAEGTERVAAGMSVTAWVPTDARADRLTLPVDALQRNEVGTFVYVAAGGGEGPPVATPVIVEVDFERDGRAVLRGDVPAEGALVVVEGNERLMPMTPLAPTPADPRPGADAPVDDGAAR